MTADRPLSGRGALVTGSSGGLGAAMARALAGAGADIMLTGLASAGAVEPLRQEIAASCGVRVAYHAADLSQPSAIAALLDEARRALGSIDILINNAVVRHFAPIETFPVQAWDRALAVNVSAAFHAIQGVLPGMRARGYGRIINMASVYGMRGTAHRVDYVTSKAAIQGLTRAVAAENADGYVTCHALCPGSVLTPASERRIREMMDREGLSLDAAEARFLEGKQPSRRFVAIESITQMLLTLCGPAGRDMNGAIIPIDGGWTAT